MKELHPDRFVAMATAASKAVSPGFLGIRGVASSYQSREAQDYEILVQILQNHPSGDSIHNLSLKTACPVETVEDRPGNCLFRWISEPEVFDRPLKTMAGFGSCSQDEPPVVGWL